MSLDEKSLEKAIGKRALDEEGILRIVDVRHSGGVTEGMNYLSEINRMEATGVLEDGSRKVLRFVVKTDFPEVSEDSRKVLVQEIQVFPVETEMYKVIIPEMERLASPSLDPEYFPWPKCWAAVEGRMFILDDLIYKGYTTIEQSDRLDLEHAIAAIQCLARFHAMSVIIKDNGILDFKRFDTYFASKGKPVVCKLLNNIFEATVNDILTTWDKKWHNLGRQLKEMFGSVIDIIAEQLAVDDTDFNVLNHGDYRTNNLLFKRLEIGNVMHAKAIDYQTVLYNSFAIDLNYFLHTSVQQDVVRVHQDMIFATYHDSLQQMFRDFNHSSKKLPSLEFIKERFERRRLFGLLIALMITPFATSVSGTSVDVESVIQNGWERVKEVKYKSVNNHLQEILEQYVNTNLQDIWYKK